MNFDALAPDVRWTPDVLFAAAGLTLILFSIMPVAQWLNRPDVDSLVTLSDLEVVRLPPPPPPLFEPAPPPEPMPDPIRLSVPTPTPPAPVPTMAQPELAFDASFLAGDFAVTFGQLDWAIEGAVFALADVDTPPTAVLQAPPNYPPGARHSRLEGEVILRFVVTAEGTVEAIDVIESRPGTVFVSAARSAVERWRFEPAQRDGRAVAVQVEVPLEFRLER